MRGSMKADEAKEMGWGLVMQVLKFFPEAPELRRLGSILPVG